MRQVHLQSDSSAEVCSGIDGLVTQLLFDTEDLVELGKTFGTSWGTSFLLLVSKVVIDEALVELTI
jgi:hypothetical protein